MAKMRCPECGSTNFKSLRIIYEDGTKTYEKSYSNSEGKTSSTKSSTQTLLAQSAAPPVAPSEPEAPAKKFNLDFFIVVLFCAYIYFVHEKVDLEDLDFIQFILLFIGLLSICFMSFFIHKESIKNEEWNKTEYPKIYEEWKNSVYAEYQRSYDQWQYNYDRWQRSYLCKKCGNIFTD